MSGLSLSVAMCTYNGSAYLGEQLRSIALQSRPPDALVAIDDGSSDRSVDILHDFAASAPFPVRVVVNPRNLGYLRNFEQAIRLSEGEVIVLADQDDFWYPSKLARMETAFASPAVEMAFSDADVVGSDLRPLGYRLWEAVGFTSTKQSLMRGGRALEVLFRRNVVTGATMAFRSRRRDMLLPIPEGVVHDGWIALLLSACAAVAVIPEPLVAYRQHGANQIGISRRTLSNRLQDARRLRTSALEELHAQLMFARQRLREHGLADGARLAQWDQSIDHLRSRISLPSARSQRLPLVCRELIGGRYASCSNGLSSALRDLLV